MAGTEDGYVGLGKVQFRQILDSEPFPVVKDKATSEGICLVLSSVTCKVQDTDFRELLDHVPDSRISTFKVRITRVAQADQVLLRDSSNDLLQLVLHFGQIRPWLSRVWLYCCEDFGLEQT